jgi:hypothetical protein
MKINGIDLTRADALTAAGIDPHGPMSQFRDTLDATYVYCNQHLRVERTDSSCTVDAFEKFPLKTSGDYETAITEARAQGFLLYREAAPCQHCGETIHMPHHSWVTVDGNDSKCAKRTPTMYSNGHEPIDNIPAARCATL